MTGSQVYGARYRYRITERIATPEFINVTLHHELISSRRLCIHAEAGPAGLRIKIGYRRRLLVRESSVKTVIPWRREGWISILQFGPHLIRQAIIGLPAPPCEKRPVQLILSRHGLRLLRTELQIDSVDALRDRIGALPWNRFVRSFDDDDRGAAPASGSNKTAASRSRLT